MCRYLLLRKGSTCYPVRVEKIVRFESCKGYTCVYLENNEVYKECGHIGLFEKKVFPSGLFVRVNRSDLINNIYIVSFSHAGGVLLGDGTRLPLTMQGYIDLLGIFD